MAFVKVFMLLLTTLSGRERTLPFLKVVSVLLITTFDCEKTLPLYRLRKKVSVSGIASLQIKVKQLGQAKIRDTIK